MVQLPGNVISRWFYGFLKIFLLLLLLFFNEMSPVAGVLFVPWEYGSPKLP